MDAIMDDAPEQRVSRRRLLAAAAATAATPALLRLATPPPAAAQDRTVTTITAMTPEIDLYNDPQNVALFERLNPGIKLRVVAFDPIRLSAALASGQPPDFVRTLGGPEIPNYAARGLCTNLDPYFAKSSVLRVSDLHPINDEYRFDGKQQGQGPRYGMGKDWSQDGTIWYNKALFRSARVAYPSATEPLTFDELLTLGKKLTVRKGGKIQVYGLNAEFGVYMEFHMLQLMAQQGKPLFNADYSEIDCTSPEARKILTFYYDYARARIGPSPLDPEANWDGIIYPVNRVAIAQWGYWFGGLVNVPGKGGKPLTDSGIAPAPLMGPHRVSGCAGPAGSWIPQGSPNKDAAWKLFEFYHGGQPARDRVAVGHGLPTLKSLFNLLPQSTPYQKAAVQVQQTEPKNFAVLRYSPYITSDAFDTIFTQYMTAAVTGQSSLEDAARGMEAAYNKKLRLGKAQVG